MNASSRNATFAASAFLYAVAALTCCAETRATADTSGAIADVLGRNTAVLAAATSPEAYAATARASWPAPALTAGAADEATPSSSSVSADSPSDASLPEAPAPVAPDAPALMFQASNAAGTAPHYAINIPSGWTAQSLTAGDKVVLSLRNLYNLSSLAGTVISAGYSHLTNGEPNYGTNREAFAKRFGAGMARSASQDIFSNGVLAPILHQDPRYYIEGSQYSFMHRVLYAATRPIIGRTDAGHTTVNASLLLGYAGAAALTPVYYPQINHNFRDVASTFGSSIGGAAIGFGVSEFSDQLLKAIHLKK